MITISDSLFAALVVHLLLLVSTLDLDLFGQPGTGNVSRPIRVILVPQRQRGAVDSAAPKSEMEPKPELKAEPEPKPEPKPKPKPQPEPQPKPEPKPQPQPQPQPKSDKVEKTASDLATSTPKGQRSDKSKRVQPPQSDTGIENGQRDSEPGPPSQQTPQDASAVSADRLADIAETYKHLLRQAIEANKRYPRVAQRRGIEGQVEVTFIVRQDGSLQQISILHSSGSQHLDRAALQTLKRLDHFMPIPDELDRREWPMRVILRFALQ